MYCSKCNFELKDDANFCSKCGSKKIKKLIYTEKISSVDLNTTDTKQTKGSFLIIGGLIVIVLLSVGFGSYYISFFNLTSNNSKISDKNQAKNNIASNNNKVSNNDSNTSPNIAASTKNSDLNKINSPNYYILPKSGSEKLLASDVSTLSKQNLALAKNEIYARRGHVFDTEPFKSYFNNKSWYKPSQGPTVLNNIEQYNVQLILKYQNE